MRIDEQILLFIIVACIIALIELARRRLRLRKKPDRKKEMLRKADADSNAPDEEPAEWEIETEPKPEMESVQVTIYEYRADGEKRLCTLCDGENDVSATQCCICGQPLDRREVTENDM